MMRIVKRFPVFVLVLAIILASVIPSVAETAERTTQEKAVVLSNLKIISGVNGEFYLDNPLRRNEAVTFIVRLIGMGDHVNQNKSQYSDTPYSDVPSTEWYAPFIGYCYQNGFITESSTAFRPLDYITEKEFLSLVLMALEYEEARTLPLIRPSTRQGRSVCLPFRNISIAQAPIRQQPAAAPWSSCTRPLPRNAAITTGFFFRR